MGDLLSKIQKLCKEKHVSITKLEQELNFGKSTIAKWNNASPTGDKLMKVANYFDVSLDYLMGNLITLAAHNENEDYTEEELEEIENFKKYVLSKRNKDN